jgi:succinate dehydrogenase / fumarate reductase cytochrome b subunit
MGLALVLFLVEHLLVNSQAALLLGEDGRGFVEMVNAIHNLPYLQALEIALLGVPILIHAALGVNYLFTARSNSRRSDGSRPALPEYGRNHAYTWQRITSWILLAGLAWHIVHLRFLDYPRTVREAGVPRYVVKISMDQGLYTLAPRLGVRLFDQQLLEQERAALDARAAERALLEVAEAVRLQNGNAFDPQQAELLQLAQTLQGQINWVEILSRERLAPGEVLAVADTFGSASLLVVRDTFKNPFYVGLYTLFVLAACFHAFNGLWTFLITWGAILKMSAQRTMVGVCTAVMLLMAFLGLAAVWGTYWLNLTD